MGKKTKATKLIINIGLIIGIILGVYFFQLSLTPEGYTGIFLWFKYNVHNSTNPLIVLSICTIALIAFNWRSIAETKNKIRLFGMVLLSAVILVGVFFFLNFKRHNRLPWNRPNVLMIVVDTLRADHVSAYGHNLAQTPNLDALAEDGWLFEQAYSHIPITLPSHSSLFTGRLPSDVWVTNNRDDFVYKNETLAEILKKNGYNTAAAISLGVLKSAFHIDRGFDYYNDDIPQNGQWFNRADVITNRGIEWLEENGKGENPFFLWLHYSDPHEPYDPPGSPADTAIILNGETLSEGSLDSAAKISVEMKLKPGRNLISIKNIYPHETIRFLTQLYFDSETLKEGPFSPEWTRIMEEPNKYGDRKDPFALQKLQSEAFMRGFSQLSFSGLRFQQTSGWQQEFKGEGRARRSLNENAEIVVHNDTGKEVSLSFTIKGGIYKDLDLVKKHYAGEVEYSDQEIGRLINYLKRNELMENTIIIVLADHGEELNEHGLVGHIHNLYTQSLQVPLIIRDPNTDHKGKAVNKIARIIDIAPTVLDMVGLHTPEYMQGRTLLEYILRNRSPERALHSQTFAPEAKDDKFGIIEKSEMGILVPNAEKIRQLEIFDLNEDPVQWRNKALNPENSGISSFKERLEKYADSIELDNSEKLVEEVRDEMLNDLGYINTTAAPLKIDDLGTPSEVVITNVQNAMNQLPIAANNPMKVETRSLGVSSSGTPLNYISITLNLPDAIDDTHVVEIQSHMKKNAKAHARQFPLRLTIYSGEKLLLDKAYPGDNAPVKRYLTLKLMRLLSLQPYPLPISESFEGLYDKVATDLEDHLGVQ